MLFIMGEFLCEIENKTKKSVTPILKLLNCSILLGTSTFFSFGFVLIFVLDIWLVSVSQWALSLVYGIYNTEKRLHQVSKHQH